MLYCQVEPNSNPDDIINPARAIEPGPIAFQILPDPSNWLPHLNLYSYIVERSPSIVLPWATAEHGFHNAQRAVYLHCF